MTDRLSPPLPPTPAQTGVSPVLKDLRARGFKQFLPVTYSDAL